MRRVACVWSLVLVFLFLGCSRNGRHDEKKNSVSGVDRHSESELRQSLDKFQEFFANTINDASDELDRLSGATRPDRSTLKLRSITIKASDAMLRQAEPLTAFVDVWVLSVRLSRYFQDGYGSKSFEPNQHVLVDAMKKIEARIESVGLEYLDEKHYDMTRQKVNEFAKANPIKPDLKETVLYATEAYEGQVNPFEEIVTLPLLPLTVVNGVTEGMTGVSKMSESADHIADVVEAFPESARWQMLMLLYDIEKLDSVKSTVESFSRFSKGTSSLSDSADKFPEKLRLEIVELLKEIEEISPDIRKTAQSVSSTSANIKEALKTGTELTKSINLTSEKIQIAAEAWQLAAKATDTAVLRMIEFSGPEDEEFDITAYKETAQEFNVLADKLTQVLHKSDNFTKKLTRRIAFLIVLLFAMTGAFTTIVICVKTKQKSKKQLQG